MTYKRNESIIAFFECECGNKLSTRNLSKIRCPRCGRMYEVEITEHEHHRVWIKDILAPIDMMSVDEPTKNKIKEAAREIIVKHKKTGYCLRCRKNIEAELDEFFCGACGDWLIAAR